MSQLDARGYSCPQPVIMAKKELAKGDCEIIVDNFAAEENVTRFAQNNGFAVIREEKDGDIYLRCSK